MAAATDAATDVAAHGATGAATRRPPIAVDALRLPPGAAVTVSAKRAIEVLAENKIVSLAVYVGFVFVKVLAVSQWRLSTALAMLQGLSLSGVAVGATLSAVPSVALAGLAAAAFMTVSGRWHGCWLGEDAGGHRITRFTRRNRSFLVAVGVLTLTVFAIASWSLTLWVLGGVLVSGLAARLWTAHVRAALGCAVLAAAWVVVLTYAQLVSAVWLPHEAVVYGPGNTTIVGYVVGSADDQLTILQSGRRTLKLVPLSAVRARRICVAGDYGFGGHVRVAHNSFLTLLVHAPAAPACPSPRRP